MLKIKSSVTKDSVESILAKKNMKYSDWRKDVVNRKKLEVMSDEDKDWLEEVVQTASIELIMENVKNEKNHH